MADTDEDWQAFLKSTELDDDEVETPPGEDENLEDEERPEQPAKKPVPEKKPVDSDADKKPPAKVEPKKPAADEDKDAAEAKKAAADKKKPPAADAYKSKLTQFHNDEDELDIEKIEKAYIETSKEGVRLNSRVEEVEGQMKQLLQAIAKDPDVAKKVLGEEGAKTLDSDIKGTTPPADPIVADYEAKLTKQSRQEYNDFVEVHPESVSDPDKAAKISSFLKFYGPWYSKENGGEIAGMKDSLEAAYRHHGWDLEVESKEDLASAARDAAATKRPPAGKKSSKKGGFTKEETFFANKLGVKL